MFLSEWKIEESLKLTSQYVCRNIPIISPGLVFGQKAFSLGLFSVELVFGGACYRKEFCVSNWVLLLNKNS